MADEWVMTECCWWVGGRLLAVDDGCSIVITVAISTHYTLHSPHPAFSHHPTHPSQPSHPLFSYTHPPHPQDYTRRHAHHGVLYYHHPVTRQRTDTIPLYSPDHSLAAGIIQNAWYCWKRRVEGARRLMREPIIDTVRGAIRRYERALCCCDCVVCRVTCCVSVVFLLCCVVLCCVVNRGV